jgi:hypothetical protein
MTVKNLLKTNPRFDTFLVQKQEKGIDAIIHTLFYFVQKKGIDAIMHTYFYFAVVSEIFTSFTQSKIKPVK